MYCFYVIRQLTEIDDQAQRASLLLHSRAEYRTVYYGGISPVAIQYVGARLNTVQY